MDVRFSDGGVDRCEDTPFARGAQGEIFKSLDGRHVIKLYRPDYLDGDRQRQLERQLDKIIYHYNAPAGDPYWEAMYSWPDRRVTYPRLGVRMRLVTGMTSLDHFFFRAAYDRLPPEKRGWWIGRVASAIKLARAVNRLHSKGLCHSDLSERNVVVDPSNGNTTLLDCDSLVVPGELPAEVLGTPEYMAPELHSGKIKEPSVFTDRHAMAVLLYRWLLYKHPLLGPKHYDADPERDEWYALGERALFIENPTDTSNRPPNLLVGADSLSPRVRELFHKAFVEGLTLPTLRPSAEAWENALIEMYDRIIPCANAACAQKFFVAPDVGPLKCPLCQTAITFPDAVPYLKLRAPRKVNAAVQYRDEDKFARYVVGWPDRTLHLWHADPQVKPTPGIQGGADQRPVAVVRFDVHKKSWSLENQRLADLQVGIGAEPDMRWERVPIGARVSLHPNAPLQLGQENIARRIYVEMRNSQ